MAAVLFAFNATAATLYVDLNGTNSTPPYAGWSTAATNIQDAIDASVDGDLVLVTNGVYSSGGRAVYGALINRVVINKAVTVQSVNGPAATMIYGYHAIGSNAVRCVYMTNNSALIGFTLKYGATANTGGSFQEQSGGGVWCESTSATVSNCVITGNAASFTGGGAMSGTFNNCLISNNITTQIAAGSSLLGGGGGAIFSVLNNCVITGNSAFVGGGAAYSTLTNCLVSGNAATAPYNNNYYFFTEGGGVFNGTANNCKIVRNSAYVGGGFYGYAGPGQFVDGVFYSFPNGTLNNCLVASNYVNYPGGGIGGTCQGTLNNCTIVANSGGQSAGALFGTLNNCVLYYNSGPNFSGGTLNNCCTTPMPTN
ncbi:MAG TPA: hypothetical protein VH598_04750, partial [Verrucomicrobiae bacterium]|nr:hypothetical protein [Verrucomicrobiae bacterium]